VTKNNSSAVAGSHRIKERVYIPQNRDINSKSQVIKSEFGGIQLSTVTKMSELWEKKKSYSLNVTHVKYYFNAGTVVLTQQ